MVYESTNDINENETYQVLVKLANDLNFFNEMRKEFSCKLNSRSNTLQWTNTIINVNDALKIKQKTKAKQQNFPRSSRI